MFQARFKQPYSSCDCEKSARTKLVSSISIGPKKATSAADVLRVLSGKAMQPGYSNHSLTHPCTHSLILTSSLTADRVSKSKGKSKVQGKDANERQHRNTLVDPPEDWHAALAKDAYGYGPAAPGEYDRPLAPLRPWATTV